MNMICENISKNLVKTSDKNNKKLTNSKSVVVYI